MKDLHPSSSALPRELVPDHVTVWLTPPQARRIFPRFTYVGGDAEAEAKASFAWKIEL